MVAAFRQRARPSLKRGTLENGSCITPDVLQAIAALFPASILDEGSTRPAQHVVVPLPGVLYAQAVISEGTV